MVSFIPNGGLGNILFQIAACLSYSLENDIKFCIPEGVKKYDIFSPNLKNNITDITFRNISCDVLIKEESFAYKKIPFHEKWRNKNILLSGYWQSEKYFTQYYTQVKSLLDIRRKSNNKQISLHRRTGDYKKYPKHHPILSTSYFAYCVDFFLKIGYKTFFVLSDDLEECKSVINSTLFPAIEFIYSAGNSSLEDFRLMSECKGHIISNSTFSWWAAYLNDDPDKVILSPHEDDWFGPAYNHLDCSTLIPKSWIRAKKGLNYF